MRNRLVYGAALLLIIIIGLPTRLFPEMLPEWIVMYAGDTLWATAVFLLLCVLLPNRKIPHVLLLAFIVTWGIEVSQLYQADWINAIRHTRIGGLILGYAFLWSDLVAYTVGILIGWLLEKFILLPISRHYSSTMGAAG